MEFHCAAIELFERVRILEYVPVGPTVEMLNYTHLDRLALVIADLDFERFVEPAIIDFLCDETRDSVILSATKQR